MNSLFQAFRSWGQHQKEEGNRKNSEGGVGGGSEGFVLSPFSSLLPYLFPALLLRATLHYPNAGNRLRLLESLGGTPRPKLPWVCFSPLGSNHKSNIRGNLGKNQGNIVFMSFKVLSAELAYFSNSSSPISKFSPALRSPLLNQQGTHPDSPVDCLLIKIDHFHRDHNAPFLPSKLLHISPENWLCKILGSKQGAWRSQY